MRTIKAVLSQRLPECILYWIDRMSPSQQRCATSSPQPLGAQPFTLTQPCWAAYNGARARPRGAGAVRVALMKTPTERRRVYHVVVAGGCLYGSVCLTCLCCRSDCRKRGKNGHSKRAAHEDRRCSVQYGR